MIEPASSPGSGRSEQESKRADKGTKNKIKQRAFDSFAAQRVGAVQHNKGIFRSAAARTITQRRNIGVKSAEFLDVVNQDVNVPEHFSRRTPRLPVQVCMGTPISASMRANLFAGLDGSPNAVFR